MYGSVFTVQLSLTRLQFTLQHLHFLRVQNKVKVWQASINRGWDCNTTISSVYKIKVDVWQAMINHRWDIQPQELKLYLDASFPFHACIHSNLNTWAISKSKYFYEVKQHGMAKEFKTGIHFNFTPTLLHGLLIKF